MTGTNRAVALDLLRESVTLKLAENVCGQPGTVYVWVVEAPGWVTGGAPSPKPNVYEAMVSAGSGPCVSLSCAVPASVTSSGDVPEPGVAVSVSTIGAVLGRQNGLLPTIV